MIDTDNLRTASLYINNQLLSRGLLRDGQTIDFADPTHDGGDTAATMGRIMSVVNDLILRRDRDAEHRESLSTAMRALRADNVKNTKEIAKLTEKNVEAQRKVDIAEASESSAKTQLKSAEAAMRGLKDEIARTKALVSQARASCATEVRRRDRQIDTLKKQLGEAGRARGSRGNPAITTITVAAGVGEENSSLFAGSSTDDDSYTLRSETNAFLANLGKELSEENEALARVIRKAMEKLREMSGYIESENVDSLVTKQPSWEDMSLELDSVLEHMRNILTNPSFVPIEEVVVREEEINRLKDGWVKMETRWKEAVHLIDGWRKRMAADGRPICDEELKMGLRLSPIRVKDVEETRMARGFSGFGGFGLTAVEEEEDEEEQSERPHESPSLRAVDPVNLVPADDAPQNADIQDDDEQSEESGYEDNDLLLDDDEEPNVEILQESGPSADLGSSPLPVPPQLSPLKNSASAGNRGATRGVRHEKQHAFKAPVTDRARDTVPAAEAAPTQTRARITAQPLRMPSKVEKPPQRPRSPSRTSLDDALLGTSETDASATVEENDPPVEEHSRARTEHKPSTARQQSPRRGQSRLPLPRNAEVPPQQSPLTMATIAAKLAASEREADAARVRAKLKAARGTRGVQKPVISKPSAELHKADADMVQTAASKSEDSQAVVVGSHDDVDPVKQDPAAAPAAERHPQGELKVEKRKRDRVASKTASRRRSTLSPWELESLISGTAQ